MACKVSEFVNLSKGPIESSSSFSVIPRANAPMTAPRKSVVCQDCVELRSGVP